MNVRFALLSGAALLFLSVSLVGCDSGSGPGVAPAPDPGKSATGEVPTGKTKATATGSTLNTKQVD